MIPSSNNTGFSAPRFFAFLLALAAASCAPVFAQNAPERFWLAGRYDSNRVIIYFDAVKFGGTLSGNAQSISAPVASGFFEPVKISAAFLARFQTAPRAEHFAIGDLYDVMLGNGTMATVKLTTLIGCETDEQVGNDSYIGAIATVLGNGEVTFAKDYYAVRHYHKPESTSAKPKPKSTADYLRFAHLSDEPVRFDIESQIAELLTQRMKTEATDAERRLAESAPPTLTVQAFYLADGSLRYYARAEWLSETESTNSHTYALAAWITPAPTLHILTVEKQTSSYGGVNSTLPNLLNVVDFGNGRTGVIVQLEGEDSTARELAEYRDGQNIRAMRLLQSISFGE